jgi:hypothetical protein
VGIKPFTSILITLLLLGVCAPAVAQDTRNLPHRDDLQSLELEELRGGGPSYRLIWHAWHRRPGALTLWCETSGCRAQLRYTDGYGTYQQGKLYYSQSRHVDRETAGQVMEAVDQSAFWRLVPHLPVDGPYGARPTLGEPSICLHAPYYFLEGRKQNQSQLVYRYCQPRYGDGIAAVQPMIDLFERLFPTAMTQVKAVGAGQAQANPLLPIER